MCGVFLFLIGREVFKKDMLMLGSMMTTRLGFRPHRRKAFMLLNNMILAGINFSPHLSDAFSVGSFADKPF